MAGFLIVFILVFCLARALEASSNPDQTVFPQRSPLETDLFGGSAGPWDGDDWVAVDDRVRGGKSKSYLVPSTVAHTAIFHGTIDTETLGDAAFASQRTRDREAIYDLSLYLGITLTYARGDGHTYTLNVVDTVASKRPDGRLNSVVQYKFLLNATSVLYRTNHIPWSAFVPYYRGHEKPDAKPLDPSNIRAFSIMIAKQKGKFRVEIVKIGAYGEERLLEKPEGRGCGGI